MLIVATPWVALFLEPVSDHSSASALADAVDFAYPLGDAVVFGATLGVFALMGWRPGRIRLLPRDPARRARPHPDRAADRDGPDRRDEAAALILGTSFVVLDLSMTCSRSNLGCTPRSSSVKRMLPSSLPVERQDEMIASAREAAHAAGATNGPLHIELMMTPTGPWVIEINGRLGGSIPYIFSEITDVALFREIAKIALGIKPITSTEFDGIGGMFNRHPPPGEGSVKRVVGLDEVRDMPGVRRVMVGVHEGDRASSLLGLLGGMVRIVCAAERVDDLFEIRDRFVETLRFEVDAG